MAEPITSLLRAGQFGASTATSPQCQGGRLRVMPGLSANRKLRGLVLQVGGFAVNQDLPVDAPGN